MHVGVSPEARRLEKGPTMELTRRSALTGALGVVGASALGGCSPAATPTDNPSTVPTATTPTPSPTPTPTVDTTPRWPLTGKVLKDASDSERTVVAVKVPDNQNEHPQRGIDKADIVFVELDGYPAAVGRSGTRLVPVFHSRYADAVGPVRSIRPVDFPLLAPMTAVVGNTGGAGWVLRYAKKFTKWVITSKTYMATKGTGSYAIDPNRVRTIGGVRYYDRAVICHPEVLAEQIDKFAAGPQQWYFPWAATDEEVSTEVAGEEAKTIAVPWKSGHTYDMAYSYDKKSGRYLRSAPWGKHVLADGTRVSTDNVLIIKAKQRFDHHEPFHDIIDKTGTFFYAHGGAYVTGTWSKGAVSEVFQFTLEDGSPLKMALGQTFVELPNTKAKVTFKA